MMFPWKHSRLRKTISSQQHVQGVDNVFQDIWLHAINVKI